MGTGDSSTKRGYQDIQELEGKVSKPTSQSDLTQILQGDSHPHTQGSDPMGKLQEAWAKTVKSWEGPDTWVKTVESWKESPEDPPRIKQVKETLLQNTARICESPPEDHPLLLDERKAMSLFLEATFSDTALQNRLMKLLDGAQKPIDRVALIFHSTSKYMEYRMRGERPDSTESDEDTSDNPVNREYFVGNLKTDLHLIGVAIKDALNEKAEILTDPLRKIYLPIEYKSRVDIQAGVSQPLYDKLDSSRRPRLEKGLADLSFTSDAYEWERRQNDSHSTRRHDLAHLGLSFKGEKVISLEKIEFNDMEGNINGLMLKLNIDKGKTYFSNKKLGESSFMKNAFPYLSGLDIEYDHTALEGIPVKSNACWAAKDQDWHLSMDDRQRYQCSLHLMLADHISRSCKDYVQHGKIKLYIVELGGGSGNSGEMVLKAIKRIKEQYPQLSVTYRSIDVSGPDNETASERFERLKCKDWGWDTQVLTRNIFNYSNA